jgi:hypothetical protein
MPATHGRRTHARAHRHPPLAGALPHVANRLAAHVVVSVGTTLRTKLLVTPLAYKNPLVSALRAPETTPPTAVAISTTVVSLLFRLLSGPTEPLVTFPNLHQSLPDHL